MSFAGILPSQLAEQRPFVYSRDIPLRVSSGLGRVPSRGFAVILAFANRVLICHPDAFRLAQIHAIFTAVLKQRII